MYYAGIDIGGMSIKIGLVDENGKIAVSRAIPTEASSGYGAMIENMATLIRELMLETGVKVAELGGIGIGIPGIADSKTGMVTTAINLGWRDVPIVEEFHKHFKVPVRISNDANCAALGEQRFGSGCGCDNVVMVTLGTGVGSGIIVDGKLVEGYRSAGAEAGHMTLIMGGEQCNCGRFGCWEMYASATALIRQTKKAMSECCDTVMHDIYKEKGKVSGRTAFIAAAQGDKCGAAVVENYIRYIAMGLISLGNILHPEVFVIGGGISHEGKRLTDPLEKYLADYAEISGMKPAIKVVPASLGNDAGIIGAACLVM